MENLIITRARVRVCACAHITRVSEAVLLVVCFRVFFNEYIYSDGAFNIFQFLLLIPFRYQYILSPIKTLLLHPDIKILSLHRGHLRGLTGRVVGHGSVAPGYKPRPGYVRTVFHLSLRYVTVGGRSAHLAYLVYNSGPVKQQRLHVYILLIIPSLCPAVIIKSSSSSSYPIYYAVFIKFEFLSHN